MERIIDCPSGRVEQQQQKKEWYMMIAVRENGVKTRKSYKCKCEQIGLVTVGWAVKGLHSVMHH